MSHAGRVLKPVQVYIPLKAGTKIDILVNATANDGEGLVEIHLDRTFDFLGVISIEDYGTLGRLIEELQKAQKTELSRIKASSNRGVKKTAPRVKSEKEIRTERRERRRRKK